MGLFSAIKKIFTGESTEEKILDEARSRHGITVDKVQMDKPVDEATRFGEDYDPWEDLRHFRSSFFLGNWAARKFHVIGEDKVKQQLEALEKKRDEEAKKKDWDKWEKEKKK